MPRFGVLGGLVVATIALPLSGAATGMDTPVDDDAAQQLAAGVNLLSGSSQALGAIPPDLAYSDGAILAELADKADRTQAVRTALPNCSGDKHTGGENGKLPAAWLCSLWPGAERYQLRSDAAEKLAELNQAYKAEFGSPMCVSSGYRTYAQQSAMNAANPSMVATAGRSNHGWGLAVDLCGGLDVRGSAKWNWLRSHGPSYGWDNPAWAQPSGVGPHEPWHWEYEGGAVTYG